jgi:hypothetical protein
MHVKSVQDLDLSKLKSLGMNSLIVDLDETLRKRNSNDIPERSIDWIKAVKAQGFKVCVTSNNPFGWKMEKVRDILDTPVTFLAFKPFPMAFKEAMRQLGSKPSNTALVGDQLFTDIFGANMLGIFTILVDPISGAEKGFFRRIMRWLENKVLGAGI